MKRLSIRLRFCTAALGVVAFSSCSGGGTTAPVVTQPATGVSTFMIRAVQASPDIGPIDVYVFASTGTQPATPIFANLQYPAIAAYVALPVTSYTITINRAGTTTQLGTELLSGTSTGAQLTVAVAGQVANSTLQLQNFVEPAETAGSTALVVHHASPAINALVSPVGIGVYRATSSSAPATTSTTQLFSFAIAPASSGLPGTSGPANDTTVSGGEYYLSPLSSTLPSPVGFAAGAPGGSGNTLSTVAASATLSGLAANLSASGYGRNANEQTLAQDTSNVVPAGAHISIFAIDSTTSAPGILIGTLDP